MVQLLYELREIGVELQEVECKAARRKVPRSLAETLSAFSNSTNGGVILLGINDRPTFEISGIEEPARILDGLNQMCSQELEPPIRPQISTHSIDGKIVVVVEVPEAGISEKPVFVKARGIYNGSYIRTADGDHQLTQYEVMKLLENRGQPQHDIEPVPESSLEDLDNDMLNRFLERVRARLLNVSRDDSELMRLTRVTTQLDDGRVVPTLAGLLMFGKFPQQFFPNLRATFVVFPNVDPQKPGPSGERYLANEAVEGSIPSIIRHLMILLNKYLSKRSVITGAPERDEPWEYPQEALREAIANALLHRDYSPQARGSQVQISLFPDRLTIANPGGLFGTVTLENIDQSDVQQARNAALMRIAEDMGLVENRGGGVAAMIAALRRHNLSLPDFHSSLTRFRVTLRNHTLLGDEALHWLEKIGGAYLASNQRLALVFAREEGQVTNSDYRRLCGVTVQEASRELSELVEKGFLTMRGSRRWAAYRLSPRINPNQVDVRFSDLPDYSKDVYEYIRDQGPVARRHIIKHFTAHLTRNQIDYRLERLLEKNLITVTNPTERASNREYVVVKD